MIKSHPSLSAAAATGAVPSVAQAGVASAIAAASAANPWGALPPPYVQPSTAQANAAAPAPAGAQRKPEVIAAGPACGAPRATSTSTSAAHTSLNPTQTDWGLPRSTIHLLRDLKTPAVKNILLV